MLNILPIGVPIGSVEAAGTSPTPGRYLNQINVTATNSTTYGEGDLYDAEFYQTIKDNYSSNYNSESTALEISTAGELAAFAKVVNEAAEYSFENKFVKMTQNIDLGGSGLEVSYEDVETDKFNQNISGTVTNA